MTPSSLRVLALPRYGRLGASSRLRFYQFLPLLESAGIQVAAVPLSSDDYVARLYAGQRPGPLSIARDYLRRLRQLAGVGRYDLLWVEKELFPGAPALLERWLGRAGVPYVVDYDDATFHRYDRSANPLLRHLWPHKIDVAMRQSRAVVAGNAYLAARASGAGARTVVVLPTVVDLARYRVEPRAASAFAIGWMGTPVTQKYLAPIAGTLAEVCAEGAARVILVGATADLALPATCPVDRRPWSEAREAADLAEFDVGVMPLADTEWERGKCGYKLIQYMAAGRPVVASAEGTNRNIVEHGVSGFLATTAEEWRAALRRLRDDPALRARMGQAGRRRVEEHYSLATAAPRLVAVLRAAAEPRR